MTKYPKKKRLVINLLIVTLLVGGTLAGIQFAKGYRPSIQNGRLQGTGLIAISSYPKSARVILNDKLTTVTDDKLYLLPDDYTIKIEKDGFHPWTKTFPIKNELVTSIDARLFPLIPATSPMTFYQVQNPTVNADGTKIAYVQKDSPITADNGLYVYSFTNNLLGSQTLQIAADQDYSQATLIWSPDSSQILALFTEKSTPTKQTPQVTEKITSAYLLSTKSLNSTKSLTDVTVRIPLIISDWQTQIAKTNQASLSLYPTFLTDILTQSAKNVYFSPDKERVLYTPTVNINLPENIVGQSLPNINSTPEVRTLEANSTYIYDLKEGTNYKLDNIINNQDIAQSLLTTPDATISANLDTLRQLKYQYNSRLVSNLSWYGSRQLIIALNNGVNIVDYDNLNLTQITQASLKDNFVIPSPDGSKLLVLTNLNQNPETYNLIAFDLK